jgi:alkyl hydroperoxide reductase subunit AhpC
MSLLINDIAPDFKSDSPVGVINFHIWIGDSYAVLFSHPKDFTPVCTTEFSAVAKLSQEFKNRNTKVIGVSVDGNDEHHGWIKDIESLSSIEVTFPIIDDTSLTVSKLYEMFPADSYLPDGRTAFHSATVRTVFIIGPDKKIRLTFSYPMAVGRNFTEILRVLDAIQLSDKHNIATPANWVIGQDIIVPTSISDEDALKKFGSIEKKLSYLRFTSQPK